LFQKGEVFRNDKSAQGFRSVVRHETKGPLGADYARSAIDSV
jgi:hypothetical protein